MAERKEASEVLRSQLLSILGRKDWTVRHLAVVCEVSPKAIEDILGGKRKNIWLSTIERISKGIDVPVAALLDDEKSKEYQIESFIRRMHFETGRLLEKDGVKA